MSEGLSIEQLTFAEIKKILLALEAGGTEVKVTNAAADPVPVVLDAAMAQKINELHTALVVSKDAGFHLAGSDMENGESIPVGIKGSSAEIISAKHTEMFAEVKEYTRAEGASQIELYVETGYVRIRTDGDPCTEDTGEPLGAGFGMAWCVPAISVYFADDATVTVVSR